ncbi:MAG: protein kinase [Cyanobacteria bacterium HKST-UBA02]|nr:protein kinase [Cyanobacteria bacterium HKST-UBA02]
MAEIFDPLTLALDDRFAIEETLGTGGMGAVFLAEDRVLKRRVAIKVMKPSVSQEEQQILRFQSEARILSKLNHRNILQVLDFGINKNNLLYLVTDYLQGESLEALIGDEGILERAELIDIFTQICEGMQHAHDNGIVHRDLKPANIMIEADRTVKILDFGIARDNTADDTGHRTRTGAALGSPLYMSPEQAGGERVTTASDVYSLGCILYQAVTGRPPFLGTTAVETMTMQRSATPPPLPQDIETELETLILSCLEKAPERRPASMNDLKEQLLLLIEQPNTEKGETSQSRPARPVRQIKPVHSRAVLAMTVILIPLLIALSFYLYRSNEKTPVANPPPEAAIEKETAQAFKLIEKRGKSTWEVQSNYAKDEDLAALADKKPACLNLASASINGSGLKPLVDRGWSFTNLGMEYTYLNDEGALNISKIKDLRKLDVTSTAITDRGMEYIAGLKELRVLEASLCDITDRGVIAVLDGCPHLDKLKITGTRATGAVIDHLRKDIYYQHLSLVGLHLKDSDIEKLAALRIKKLDLGSNHDITARGVEKAARAQNLEHLTVPDCTGISEDALKDLEQKCPDTVRIDTRGPRITPEH